MTIWIKNNRLGLVEMFNFIKIVYTWYRSMLITEVLLTLGIVCAIFYVTLKCV